MANALQNSGRDIVLGICEWGQRQCEEWCEEVGGQLWRTSGDVRDMWKDIVKQGGMGILDIIDITAPLAKHARQGQWPDMDMLVVGRRLPHDRISDTDEHVVYAVVGACHDQRPAQGDRR